MLFSRGRLGNFVPVLAALVSALLLILSFPPYDQAWAGWLALAPIALGLRHGVQRWQTALAIGYGFGLLQFAVIFFWLHEVTWLGCAVLPFYLALFPAAWCLLWWFLSHPVPARIGSLHNIRLAVLGASAWVVQEWLRGHLLTGLPWNDLGVSQYQVLGLIQIAEFGGVLLVSWLVAMMGLTIALTLARLVREAQQEPMLKNRWEFTLAVGLTGLSFAFGVTAVFQKSECVTTLHYLAVQPNIPQSPWGGSVSLDEALAKMEVLTLSGLSRGEGGAVDLVVWPETPVGEEIYATAQFRPLLKSLTGTRHAAWLFGSTLYAGNALYNSAILFNPGSDLPEVYNKNHLVLFGEYTPLADRFPLIRKLTPLGMDFSPGREPLLLHLQNPELSIAPLICFEDTLPDLVRRFGLLQPDLFINMTNDGWFNRSPESAQHLANAVFRAVENRRPLLRVTNSGVTALITEKGVITSVLRDAKDGTYVEGSLRGAVRIPAHRVTLYQCWGDWIAWVSALLLLAGLSVHGFSRIKAS